MLAFFSVIAGSEKIGDAKTKLKLKRELEKRSTGKSNIKINRG